MKEMLIFVSALVLGAVLSQCTARDRQIADEAAHEICRVIQYGDGARAAVIYAAATDAGDPSLVTFARFLDDLERRMRPAGDGGRD